MRLLGVLLVVFVFQVAGENGKKSTGDVNRACLIRFLQIKGKIEEDFLTTQAPPALCRILLPLIYANHSERLCLRLWETKSVKAECVFEILKSNEFIDLELKSEIYSHTKNFAKNERKIKLNDITTAQRNLLLKAAKICRSDATYGGIFDEVLGINHSLISQQEEYCLLRYSAENRFLFIPNMRVNPRGIDISKVNCLSIIMKSSEDAEQKLLEAFRKRKFSSETINCLLKTYHDNRIFGWNVAKDILRKINVADSARRAEDWRISKVLSDFNRASSNCLFAFNWMLF